MTIRSARFASIVAIAGVWAIANPVLAQQATPTPAQTTPSAPRRGQSAPVETPAPPAPGQTRRAERPALPQGFSVVLVLGDIQGASTADDVPPAARKALVDMREFLPFKSYKLLDAAWVLCCGQQGPGGSADRHPVASSPSSPQMLSQVLRGPDDQEYELKLSTSRAEGSQVFVRFTLFGGVTSSEAVADSAMTTTTLRTTTRRIADLKDKRSLLEKQIQDAQKKADVGIAPASDVPKLELELRRTEREIEDLSARLAETEARATRGARPAARTFAGNGARNPMIDTSFTMNVGETVVVGTSRLKGGSRALIALLTAVPPRTTGERRE